MSLVTIARANEASEERGFKYVADAIKSIRYGSVLILVQNGKLIQVETREKRRFGLSENAKNNHGGGVN